MVKRFNRLLAACYVVADLLSAGGAFVLAYFIRFETPFVRLVPVTKGTPPFAEHLVLAPFVAVLVPISFHLQGLYRLRRGRTRRDDLFAVVTGTALAVLLGVVGTLYAQAYYPALTGSGPISRAVWGLFLIGNALFTYTSREVVRDLLRWRWRAGIGLKRVLIAGAGSLGRMVADRLLDHSELGFQPVGFVDDRADAAAARYRGLPLLGRVADIADVWRREEIDEIYVGLPIDEHLTMLGVVEFASREGVDVHIVPDLLQVLALRARLQDFDGLPIISINDVPLRGINSVIKRATDLVVSAAVLLAGAIPALIIAGLIKRGSPGPVLYAQERMGLDGHAFAAYKFRSMPTDAEAAGDPVWARDDDPRATPLGRWLRRSHVDELPQFWNVFRGEMSIVGPRPERPFFVQQFKRRIPRYMLRHKVKAGITGWAQVSGWRGDTSLEKRIEFDLYYIQNWSLALDLKIMWLTLWRVARRLATGSR